MNEFIVKTALIILAVFIAIALVLNKDPNSGSLRSSQAKVANKMIQDQSTYSDR